MGSTSWRAAVTPALTAALMLCGASAAPAADPADERGVLAAIERLSASTAPGGGGADAYGRVLDDAYTRWTVGSETIQDKDAWVEGVRGWFDDGWRVAQRDTRNLEIVVRDDLAFTRRIVTETYRGPGEETSVATAALAEIWVRSADEWKLLRVDVHPVSSR